MSGAARHRKRLVAGTAPRRVLRDHAGKRCVMARRGGRSRGRPRRWICRRRPPRWQPTRWECSAGPRVRRRPLRWTTIPSRKRTMNRPVRGGDHDRSRGRSLDVEARGDIHFQ